jgi:hypothetical protein
MPPTLTSLEPALREVSRRAAVQVVRAHPEWTLEELRKHINAGSPGGRLLGSVTIHELFAGAGSIELPKDGGPIVQLERLERAKRAHGAEFDALVLEVLTEASRPVGAGYLRARVGGPRWKLQAAMRRLLAAELVVRTGSTSATLHRCAERRP